MKCLREAPTEVLQNASFKVSEAGPWGTFAFVPVTDGEFIQERPTVQLVSGSLNGKRVLSGNLANVSNSWLCAASYWNCIVLA